MTQPCQRHMTCAWLQPLTGLAPLCHLCMPACTVRSASKALQKPKSTKLLQCRASGICVPDHSCDSHHS